MANKRQDFNTDSWIWPDGKVQAIEAMNLKEILMCIWSLYILISKNEEFTGIIKSPLYSSLMSKMRDNVTELSKV